MENLVSVFVLNVSPADYAVCHEPPLGIHQTFQRNLDLKGKWSTNGSGIYVVDKNGT